MTRKQRNDLVAVRAEIILTDEPAAAAYTLHFEDQLRRGRVRRRLYRCYARFVRGGMVMLGLDAKGHPATFLWIF
jgi:hypothetical protein